MMRIVEVGLLCVLLGYAASAATFTVTSTNDAGAGTLREAITNANGVVGIDLIRFNIPTTPSYSLATIRLTNELPTITESLVIDGTTQTSNSCPPGIELDGTLVPMSITAHGLNITADGCLIRGLVINQFPIMGVAISDTNGFNRIEGCYIGTDTNGTAALPNGLDGVFIQDSPNNKIGGLDVTNCAERNIISGNGRNGIYIYGSRSISNLVYNNYVGTDVGGMSALPNRNNGIVIENQASQNSIGSRGSYRPLNIISGNATNGVLITDNAANNKVLNNHIGVARDGTVPLGNGGDGVLIFYAGANEVGDSSGESRNIIAANGDDGVEISGITAIGNSIKANYIGIASNGFGALPNGDDGVVIADEATQNSIGGTVVPNDRNLISGNNSCGVLIENWAFGNFVYGNYIGVNRDGIGAVSNRHHGVLVYDGAFGNWIGNVTVTNSGNIISGNGIASVYNGILLVDAANNNYVAGNLIGLGANNAPIPNQGDGIQVRNCASNTIGGEALIARNVISANGGDGIQLGSNAVYNVVLGNYIGTDTNGIAARGNGNEGILIFNSEGNDIGGTNQAAGNVISANQGSGVKMSGSAMCRSNRILNCFIGTDVTGGSALGNSDHGVWILDAPNNRVGKYWTTNVISGNAVDGVRIEGAGAIGNEVTRNMIGVNLAGSAAVANGQNGVTLINAPSNTIGMAGGRDNRISGNLQDGIQLAGATAVGNVVHANKIGTDSGGGALPNGRHGVLIWNNASDNEIGSTNSISLRNTIANNGGDGVRIISGTNNSVVFNVIRDNGELGIDLGTDGVTLNDDMDPDTGANFLQNYPVIYSASTSGGLRVKGRLNSLPLTDFDVLIYWNNTADSSGYGEGELYEGETNLTTDASGNAEFELTFSGTYLLGRYVTAIAADPYGNSSEFSKAVEILSAEYWDDDGDGMPTLWEGPRHLDPFDATGTNGAAGDPDIDYVNNYDEYIADTDPSDSSNYLHLVRMDRVDTNMLVEYTSTNTRYYTVQYTFDLLDTSDWSYVYLPAIQGSNGLTADTHPEDWTPRRYRVKAQLRR